MDNWTLRLKGLMVIPPLNAILNAVIGPEDSDLLNREAVVDLQTSNGTRVQLIGLQPHHRYRLTLRARTGAGAGQPVTLEASTTPDGRKDIYH